MKRKILAIVLVATLIFSTLPVFAANNFGEVEVQYEINKNNVGSNANPLTVSAGPDGKIDYVALGDSISFGYGLPAMGKGTMGTITEAGSDKVPANAAFVEIKGSYPDLIRNYLDDKFGRIILGDKYSFEQLSVSGTRALDYLIFLDKYKEDTYHSAYYKTTYFGKSDVCEQNYKDYKDVLPESIKKADFITFTVGGNDTMSFLLLALMTQTPILDNEIENLKKFYGETAVESYFALKEKLTNNDKVASVFPILDALLYAMGSAIDGIPETLDTIHEMNPTAVIAFTGLPEIFKGYKLIDKDGKELLDLGQLFIPMAKVLNAYIRSVAEERSSYVRYVDIADFDNLYNGDSKLTFNELQKDFLFITHPSELGQKHIADSIMENFKFTTGIGTVAAIKNYVTNTYTMIMSKSGISKVQNFLAAIKEVDFTGMIAVLNGLFTNVSSLFSSGN